MRIETKQPTRTCIGCRTKRQQADLLRCVYRDDGPTVDRIGAGRGAWVCGAACGRVALERRAFDRAWRRTVEPSTIEAMLRKLEASVTESV